jgi:RNA polymerase sigma-70 factor (ECF subfamily)
MKTVTDEQLIVALLEGRTAALDELYARYARRLYVFCDHTLDTSDPQEAEDVVQDVFMRVIRAAHTFDPRKASFATWLYRIARNRCIDAKRKKGRFAFARWDRPAAVDGVDEGPALIDLLPASDDDVESQLIESALRRAVGECIRALENDEEREAILLYYLGGKVYREIAEVLGKSLSTAKNRVTAAKEKVKACLAGKGFQQR